MNQEEKRAGWAFAEGLSKVDNLETSKEFKELREREIRGEITTVDMRAALTEMYRAIAKNQK